MPTNRRQLRRSPIGSYDSLMRVHLELGDCLMPGVLGKSCACGLFDVEGALREDLARRMWVQHRAEILREWKGPEPLPWAAEEFDA